MKKHLQDRKNDEPNHFDVTALNLTGKSILIAEDIEINQQVIRGMLEPTNASILFVGNGKKAVEAFNSDKPDLILMDIRMPVMDGITACKSIRAIDDKIPIVAVTANTNQVDIDLYVAAGFTDCAGKPLDFEAFHLLLNKLIKGDPDDAD